MATKILLLGRKTINLIDAQSQLVDNFDLEIYTGTNIDDVRTAFTQSGTINHVFMGAGIEIEKRLEIVREVFALSGETTVHLKDAGSGPKGFLPFVKAVLGGLGAESL